MQLIRSTPQLFWFWVRYVVFLSQSWPFEVWLTDYYLSASASAIMFFIWLSEDGHDVFLALYLVPCLACDVDLLLAFLGTWNISVGKALEHAQRCFEKQS